MRLLAACVLLLAASATAAASTPVPARLARALAEARPAGQIVRSIAVDLDADGDLDIWRYLLD